MRTADPAKVKRIIDAAVQLFAERPYHEVRMEDIATRAQVAKGTLYLHYKDKEALFVGMKSTWLRSLVDRIESSLRDEMSPEEKLLTLNRESFSFFETNHFFLEVLQRLESIRLDGKSECFEEPRVRLQELLLRIIREFPSRVNATDEELALEVVAISGMMKEILFSLPRPWPKDLPDRVTRLFLYGMQGGAAPAPDRKKQGSGECSASRNLPRTATRRKTGPQR